MRRAVVVALGDPRSSDAGTWVDAVAWLRQELSDREFRVVVVDGEDVETDLARALEELSRDDEIFFHVSGRLAERGVIKTATGRWIRLDALGDALAAHAGERTEFFAELLHDDDPADGLLAAEHLSWLIEAITPRARRYAMVAAVRPRAAAVDGLALTRLFLAASREVAPGPGPLLTSAVYRRVAADPSSARSAQNFTFIRSGAERDASSSPSSPMPSFEAVPLSSFPAARPAASDSDPPSSGATTRPVIVDGVTQSLSDRIDEAAGSKQWRRVISLRRERLQQVEQPRLRVRELVAIARILQVELDDAEGAIATLEEARAIDPARIGVLQALQRGYERLGRWEAAFEVLGALVDAAPSPSDRAELRYAQARLAMDRLGDTELAFTLLQGALADDPAHERALATFDEVCALRARTVDSDGAQRDAPTPNVNVLELVDDSGAIAVAVAAAAEPPAPPPADDTATNGPNAFDLLPSDPPPPLVPPSSTLGPVDPSPYHAAFEHHWREGRTDSAMLAAQALEDMGVANADQQILVDQFRSVAPIRARGTLDAAAWGLLRAEGSDDGLAAVFAAVARAAVTTRLEQLVSRRRLVTLDPARRLDETSTASVVRSFQWASRVLGVPCPVLYVVDDVPGEIAAVRAWEPSTAVGPSVLRGRSSKDLAFLAGRHLTYYRPEHQVLVYFPTGEDLGRLLTATLELGSMGQIPPSEDRVIAALRARLETHLTPADRAAIAAATGRLTGEVDLGRWARSVELTAGRAGLLLCGDLATSSAIVRAESRAIAGISADDKRRDLVTFCSSAEHAELRARFAVTAPESVRPPRAPALPYSP